MIFSSNPDVVRVAGCVYDSSVDGPGIRYTLFFQGCHHNCPGCHNRSTHAWDGADCEDVPVDVLIENFKKNSVANRVTISGGEPFGQPNALLTLVKELYAIGVKDIWVYTGYELDDLQSELHREILSYVSAVVTGRFMIDKKDGAPLFTGSSNQQVHEL